MKRIALLAAALVAPSMAHAVGIGASVNTHDGAFYVPFDITPALRLEPYFQYSSTKDDTGITVKNTALMIGAGAFVHRPAIDHIEVYVGGRLAYEKFKQTVGAPVNATSDQDGFRLEPTIGAAYLVTDRVSVAVEQFIGYEDLSGNGASSKSTETGNRILLRIMLPRMK